MKFYKVVESYCDCQLAYTNTVKYFTDEDTAILYKDIFTDQNQCSYTDYYVDCVEPDELSFDTVIDNPVKYERQFEEEYTQWMRY